MPVIEIHSRKLVVRLVRSGVIALLAVSSPALARQGEVTGRVTFVAGPTVYAAIGRKAGLVDSCSATVRSGTDTIAVLRLIAFSSRSSSWSCLWTTRDIVIGDTVVVTIPQIATPAAGTEQDTAQSSISLPPGYAQRMNERSEQAPAIRIHGRLSVQYYGIQFEESAQSLAQPALGISLGAEIRDVPLKLTFHGVQRQRSYGTLSPLDGKSRPETRLYRASADYDDGTMILQAGRFYPMSSLPMSAIDGGSVARRIGNFTVGFAGGAEPVLSFKYRQKHLWKGMTFLSYQTMTPISWGTGVLYSRSYIHSELVRETASLSFSLLAPSGLTLTGFSDIDLRRPMSKPQIHKASLASIMVLGSARVHPSVSIFAGVDAARPVPAAPDYGIIPDTLLSRTLRSGATLGASLSIQPWMWNINYSPRMGPESFGKEYSASTSLGTPNLLSSGVDTRFTANLNSNAYTVYEAYGIQARRNDFGIDWRVRFQYYATTIRQTNSGKSGTVGGIDLMALISQTASVTAGLDLWRGATLMNVMFFEVSWRF